MKCESQSGLRIHTMIYICYFAARLCGVLRLLAAQNLRSCCAWGIIMQPRDIVIFISQAADYVGKHDRRSSPRTLVALTRATTV